MRLLSKCFFDTDRHGASTALPGSLLQCFDYPHAKEIFPEVPSVQFWDS